MIWMDTLLETAKNSNHQELLAISAMQTAIWDIFAVHGYRMIDTPLFESYDLYSQYAPHIKKDCIKTIDRDGEVLALRSDITLSLIQSVAQEYKNRDAYAKYAYISPVFLPYQGKHSAGHVFLQAGAEIIGSDATDCDSELLDMALKIVETLGVTQCQTAIGSVAYMKGLYEAMNLTKEQQEAFELAMEARNGMAIRELSARWHIDEEYVTILETLAMSGGPYEDVIETVRSFCKNDTMRNALERLDRIVRELRWIRPQERIYLEFIASNHLDYYTDMMFKIYALGAPYALVSGGRYNELAGKFGKARPACGFGLNLQLLREYIELYGEKKAEDKDLDILIFYSKSDATIWRSVEILRHNGWRTIAVKEGAPIHTNEARWVFTYDEAGFTGQSDMSMQKLLWLTTAEYRDAVDEHTDYR